ncbi:MAG: hypothetical protein K9N55_00490 [Phycisphaerae bacterium]|nr:hypothetical protein [Phycisphaerae bacterium]
MKTKPISTQCWPAMMILACLAGCVVPPDATPRPTPPRTNVTPQSFQESSSKTPSAVQSAIEMSQKVADLSEQLTALRQEKATLTAENEQNSLRIKALEPELEQTQKELREANDLLIEMRLELNNWKEDVLGFRTEMRDADQAQLEALLKILQLLGGEIVPDTPRPVVDQNNPTESDPNV